MIEQGRVAEQGTHEELVKRAGLYAALWRVQSGTGPAERATGRTMESA